MDDGEDEYAALYPAPPQVTWCGGLTTDLDSPIPSAPPGVVVNTNFVCDATVNGNVFVPDVIARFPAAGCFTVGRGQIRLRSPRVMCLAMSSGHLLLSGARDPYQALYAAWKVVVLFRRAGVADVSLTNFLVCNIGSTSRVDGMVDIYSFSSSDFPNTTPLTNFQYFPGRTIKSVDGGKTALTVFSSGSFIIVGAPTQALTRSIAATAQQRLAKYIVRDPEGMARLVRCGKAVRVRDQEGMARLGANTAAERLPESDAPPPHGEHPHNRSPVAATKRVRLAA